jgi:hypothetical protein
MTINPHSQSVGYRQSESAEARRAALAGTRAHIANEQFAALVTLLIDLEVCSVEQAGAMIQRLAERLSALAHEGWQRHDPEIRMHARWLRQVEMRLEK